MAVQLSHEELKKLLTLLRKNGVLSYESDGVKLQFSPEAMRLEAKPSAATVDEVDPKDPWAKFPSGDLSPTQLQFYSAGGDPENDPENVDGAA